MTWSGGKSCLCEGMDPIHFPATTYLVETCALPIAPNRVIWQWKQIPFYIYWTLLTACNRYSVSLMPRPAAHRSKYLSCIERVLCHQGPSRRDGKDRKRSLTSGRAISRSPTGTRTLQPSNAPIILSPQVRMFAEKLFCTQANIYKLNQNLG